MDVTHKQERYSVELYVAKGKALHDILGRRGNIFYLIFQDFNVKELLCMRVIEGQYIVNKSFRGMSWPGWLFSSVNNFPSR